MFEEVTVKSTTETVDGPQGPIEGALLVEELLMDGVLEDKIFAHGYGEFTAQVVSEEEVVTVSVGVPRDHLTAASRFHWTRCRRRRQTSSRRTPTARRRPPRSTPPGPPTAVAPSPR